MTFLSVLTVLVMSVAKFFLCGLVSYGFNHTFMETLLLTAIGACLGTFSFFRLGKRVIEWFRLRYVRRRTERLAKGLAPKRIFTRTNRMIVRVKHNYGLLGIALLPPILSVPITAMLAAKYFRHDRRALPILMSAVIAWSVVLSTAWGFVR
mgnify:CR=1 FL=1